MSYPSALLASQGSFVPHGRQDILTTAIGRPEHPGRVRAVRAGIQSQGLALPPEPEVGPSGPRVSTKESCVAPSGNDPEMGDSNKCGLYIEENPSRLIALERLYEGSTIVHNIPLLHGQVKVGVEEVKDAEALVPVPTDKVTLVGQTLNTFLAWPTHLVKCLSEHLCLQQNLQKAQMKSHLTETSVRAENSDVYGFLEPQSIQRSGQSQFESESYIKSWIQSSKRDVYLGAYLNGALKGLDDTSQPKSKAAARWIVVKCNRQKGIIECGYYVMHWMCTIILGSFRNNWETYFNEVRSLEVERFKALRIQWAHYYLKVRNQT
ncbi:hypothetical protein HKD37_09G025492 [Glycine soja]